MLVMVMMLLMGMIVEIIVMVMLVKGYDDGDDAGALDHVGVIWLLSGSCR